MKKLFLTSSFMLLLSVLLYAENPTPLSFGVKVGYTYSDLNTLKSLTDQAKKLTSTFGTEGSSGSIVGVYARLGGEKIFLQPELIYVTQNSKILEDIDDSASTVLTRDLKYTTLNAPIQLGVRVLNLPTIKVRIFGGPVASIKIDSKLDIQNNINSLIEEGKDDFKSLNWSVQGGVGVDVLKFNIDIGFHNGLTDISEDYFKKAKMYYFTVGFSIL